FLFEGGDALFSELRKMRFATGPDEVRRRSEAIPETLGSLPRRLGHFVPLGVKLAKGACRGSQIRRLTCLVVVLERCDDGLGHGDELFLPLRVRKPAPLIHLS